MPRVCTHVRMYAFTHAHTHARTQARTPACTHTRLHARALVRMYTYKFVRTPICTYVRMHACTHEYMRACTHTRSHKRSQSITPPRKHVCMYASMSTASPWASAPHGLTTISLRQDILRDDWITSGFRAAWLGHRMFKYVCIKLKS